MARPKGITVCHPERPHSSLGLCKLCYQQQSRRKRGVQPRRRQAPIAERLALKTDKSAGPDGCWLWTGTYGQYEQPCMWQENKTASVRRVVWELETKSKPQKHRLVTVTCGNSRCVNPKHLAIRTVIDIVSKFWEKVERRGPADCWNWIGNKNRSGYGRHYRNKTEFFAAHRFSYELHHQVKLEPSVFVCHRCDNPSCVNPAHLWLGTPKDNHDDCVRKGRHARGEKLSKAVRAAHERKKARLAASSTLPISDPK
jgi:hypothetical protein